MKTSLIPFAFAAACLLLSTTSTAQKDTLSSRYPTAASYDSIKLKSNNVLVAYRGEKLGVVTSDGQLALPFIYDDSEPAFANGFLKIYKNGLEGIINNEGKLIVEPFYQYVSTANPGFFVVKLNDQYGTIGTDGKPLIPTIYTHELLFSDGLAVVQLNGKYGYIDPQGGLSIGYQYDTPANFKNGRAMVTLNGETYEIDKQNKRVTPEVAPKTVKEAKAKDEMRRRKRS